MEDPHIMVCVADASSTPKVAPHARALAEAAGGRLSLVHVSNGGEGVPSESEEAISVSRRKDESVSAAIARAADEVGADVISADSHHLTMTSHLLQGSTSMEVLRHTNKPLLVAGPRVDGKHAEGGYHVVICSDGSSVSANILPKLTILAAGSVRFSLLRVYEPRLGDEGRLIEMDSCEDYLHVLRSQMPDSASTDCHVSMVDGLESVPHAIIRAAEEMRADAIAMATRGESAARHVLVGSVALAVAGHANVPVLFARG